MSPLASGFTQFPPQSSLKEHPRHKGRSSFRVSFGTWPSRAFPWRAELVYTEGGGDKDYPTVIFEHWAKRISVMIQEAPG